ncbi:SCP-like protein [Oesophagostomum dentatum]|uniref:SCP-like protein n=1 Tax=Oesophagostomum dentatum TaxID=61180 RepID=A0A0B1RYS1_OESDE|nr:SCP-like protein [Oesophagostomum dentatum]
MLMMVYDCEVEASAMKQAQKCVFAHSQSSERPELGENLFMTTARNYDKNSTAARACQGWWSELKQYGVGQDNVLTMDLWNRPNTQIDHYTQMAWDTTYKPGCAVVHCSSMTYAVCQYGPAGNYMNRQIYSKGEPCSQCPEGYTCSKDEGLCNVIS